ncbi:MAG: fibronectin type III domain-containing protein [Gemmatimonadota bacterium]
MSDNVTAPLRPLYFDQQLLGVGDFVREQQYHAALRELLTRLTCTPGVISGLTVVASSVPAVVSLLPGIAIDASGHAIMLADVATLHVSPKTAAPTDTPLAASNNVFPINFADPSLHTVGVTRRWTLGISFAEQNLHDEKDPAQAYRMARQAPVLTLSDSGRGDPAIISLAAFSVIAASEPAVGQAPAKITVTVVIDSTVTRMATFAPALMPSLDASLLRSGVLARERLPSIDAATLTGELPASRISGVLGLAQLPDVPVSKVTGVLSVDQLPEIPTSKVIGLLDATQLPHIPASLLVGAIDAGLIPDLPVSKVTGVLGVDQLPEIPTSKVIGLIDATQLPHIPTSLLVGTIDAGLVPDLPASKVTGVLGVAQVPDLPASKVTGVLGVAQVPDLPASKVTGVLGVAQVPDLPAAKVSGVLDVKQLPSIPASKITGAFDPSQLPAITEIAASKITGVLDAKQLPDTPAARITGTLAIDRVPNIPVAKLAGVLTDAQVPNTPATRITGTLTPQQLPPINAASLVGTLSVDRLPPIPPDRISPPLGEAQIPLLKELMARVVALEDLVHGTILPTPVPEKLTVDKTAIIAEWIAVPGAQRYEVELQSSPHPFAAPPTVRIVVPSAGEGGNPRAYFTGVQGRFDDVLHFRVRAVADERRSAWSPDVKDAKLSLASYSPAPLRFEEDVYGLYLYWKHDDRVSHEYRLLDSAGAAAPAEILDTRGRRVWFKNRLPVGSTYVAGIRVVIAGVLTFDWIVLPPVTVTKTIPPEPRVTSVIYDAPSVVVECEVAPTAANYLFVLGDDKGNVVPPSAASSVRVYPADVRPGDVPRARFKNTFTEGQAVVGCLLVNFRWEGSSAANAAPVGEDDLLSAEEIVRNQTSPGMLRGPDRVERLVIMLLPAPTSVKVVDLGSALTVTWQPVPRAEGYVISLRSGDGTPLPVQPTPTFTSATSAKLPTDRLSPSATYQLVVRARSGKNLGEMSAPVSIVRVGSTTLQKVDWKTEGDSLLTYDPRSRLYWLNWTVGLQLTRDQMQAQLAPGGMFAGFQYADPARLLDLMMSAGVPNPGARVPANIPSVKALISLLGANDYFGFLGGGNSTAAHIGAPGQFTLFTIETKDNPVTAKAGEYGSAATNFAGLGHALVIGERPPI